MCVYFLNLDLYYTCLMIFFLHYSDIYQTNTKYYYNYSYLQDIILLIKVILLFVTINYECKQNKKQ